MAGYITYLAGAMYVCTWRMGSIPLYMHRNMYGSNESYGGG